MNSVRQSLCLIACLHLVLGLPDVLARQSTPGGPLTAPATRDAPFSADGTTIVRQTLTDGTHIREQLLAHSDPERSYTYDFQKTPFDVDNYCATLRVTPLTDGGGSFVEWWTTFDCDRDQQTHWTGFFASEVFQGGLEALKAHFAG